MASHTFSQKKFIPTPPEKGSFPLDHENLCKRHYFKYMSCLRKSDNDNSKCRLEAKEYLSCRMDNNLMETTSWSKLGFEDDTKKTTTTTANKQ